MDNKVHFDIKDLITPAVGYLFVALVCIMAGKSLHNELTFQNFITVSPEQFLYWLLLVPIFINRVIMYEQSSDKDISNVGSEWKKMSLQFPVIILIFTVFVFAFLSFLFLSSGASSYKISGTKILGVIICVTPLYIQAYVSWKNWVINRAKNIFNFRNYIFFPAISTCVISFIVGWTELNTTDVLVATSAGILFYYGVSFIDKSNFKGWKYSDWIMLCLTIFGFVYFFLVALPLNLTDKGSLIDWNSTIIVLLSCIMMTLIMGITETWWLIKDVENKAKFEEKELNFYERRINKVTATLPLIMPLSIFNPQTNNTFYLILLYAVLLCIIWFYFQSIKNKYWRWIRFFFGILLPVLFAFALRLGSYSTIVFINNKTVANILPAFSLGLALIAFLRPKDKKNSLFKEFAIEKQIAIGIIALMMFFLWVISQLIQIQDEVVLQKVNLLQLFYVIMTIVFLFEAIIKIFNISKTDEDGNNNDVTIKSIVFFMVSGRPLTSLLSGILAFLILFSKSSFSVVSIFKILPVVLITMIGFVYNDIYDKQKDLIAKKLRPITTGKLSVKLAIFYSLIVVIMALSLEFFVNNKYSLLLLFLILSAVLFYSPVSKKIPLTKAVYTAFLCCSPLIYGFVVAMQPIEWVKILPILLFIIGREIWLDKIDFDGDLKSNIKTITFYIGSKLSTLIAFALMFVGIMLIPVFNSSNSTFYLSCISFIILSVCLLLVQRNENISVKVSKVSMLLGIIALALT